MVVEQVRSGRKAEEVAAGIGVSAATVYRWVRQDKIDSGELSGTPTVESAQLRAARQRITELEAELATVKRASELFGQGRVVRPKDIFPVVETLAKEGHGTKRCCRILAVAPSGFFRWRPAAPTSRAIRRAWLADVITEIHDRSRCTEQSTAEDPRLEHTSRSAEPAPTLGTTSQCCDDRLSPVRAPGDMRRSGSRPATRVPERAYGDDYRYGWPHASR
jgi:transposase-like protein